MINEVYNMDCMEYLKTCVDNQFDLAIVDPPYGIGKNWEKRNKSAVFKQTTYKNNEIPSAEYFNELKRISRNQIIFGYNYYTKYLGSTNYLIIWDKQSANNQVVRYSKCEIAYTSIKIPCNKVENGKISKCFAKGTSGSIAFIFTDIYARLMIGVFSKSTAEKTLEAMNKIHENATARVKEYFEKKKRG